MASSRLVSVLTSDPDGPVVRYRWRAFEAALADAGISLEVLPWPKARRGRRQALERAESADGVVVSSRLLRRLDVRALRRRARRMAFDVDDALWCRDSARGATPSFTRRTRFGALARAADRVFAGNAYLAKYATDCGGRVDVLPTVVDVPARYATPPPREPPLVLGWIGSDATLPYLEGISLALAGVIASGVAIRIRVIANRPPRLPPGIAVETVPWTQAGWRDALSDTHVGLAPLPDDAWTRGKCGLKVLQVMSVGRPIVAGAVGVQNDQVRHGVTGLLARTEEETYEALMTLLGDSSLRESMGREALDQVRCDWSVESHAPRVVDTVRSWLD